MTKWNTEELIEADKRFVWHPFTAGAASLGAAAMFKIDEVLTGFGRTGRMFPSEHESVVPDLMTLGKGLTEKYLPIAITLSSEELFSAFDCSVADGRALAYGHSYTANALAFVHYSGPKAVAALRASIIDVWRCNNASAGKDAEKATA